MVALRTHARTYCTCCVYIHVLVIYGLMTYVMLVLLPNTSFWTHDLSLCECTSRCRVGSGGTPTKLLGQIFLPAQTYYVPALGDVNETGHAVLKTNAMIFSGVSQCRGTTSRWNMQTICERHFTLVRQMRKVWVERNFVDCMFSHLCFCDVFRCCMFFFHVCFRAMSFLCAVVLSSYASYAFANYIWLYGYAMYVYVG